MEPLYYPARDRSFHIYDGLAIVVELKRRGHQHIPPHQGERGVADLHSRERRAGARERQGRCGRSAQVRFTGRST